MAIDPAVTAGEDSDETGIIIAGVANGSWLCSRRSLFRGSPNEWAGAAVAGYLSERADRIVAEANNGGDMVITTIQTVDKSVSCKKVWASRGKYTRAEPVAALYEQGKIHHVGLFAELEAEMCNWVPGELSPNRMDALVWAFTELMLDDGADYQAYSSAGESR